MFHVTEKFLSENKCEPMQPYQFKMEAIEGLRYRANDALSRLTKHVIAEARKKEIAHEILTSDALKVC